MGILDRFRNPRREEPREVIKKVLDRYGGLGRAPDEVVDWLASNWHKYGSDMETVARQLFYAAFGLAIEDNPDEAIRKIMGVPIISIPKDYWSRARDLMETGAEKDIIERGHRALSLYNTVMKKYGRKMEEVKESLINLTAPFGRQEKIVKASLEAMRNAHELVRGLIPYLDTIDLERLEKIEFEGDPKKDLDKIKRELGLELIPKEGREEKEEFV